MPKYFQFIYYLQEKSTYFCLEVSVVYVISSRDVVNCFKYIFNIYFGTKCLKKLDKKNCELYQVFVC